VILKTKNITLSHVCVCAVKFGLRALTAIVAGARRCTLLDTAVLIPQGMAGVRISTSITTRLADVR
jgi:hypothetical protein